MGPKEDLLRYVGGSVAIARKADAPVVDAQVVAGEQLNSSASTFQVRRLNARVNELLVVRNRWINNAGRKHLLGRGAGRRCETHARKVVHSHRSRCNGM